MEATKLSAESLSLRLAADPTLALKLESIGHVLSYAEYALAAFMLANGAWPGPPPVKPDGYTSGSIEFGVLLFLFNNTSFIQDPNIRKDAEYIMALRRFFGITGSQLPTDRYEWICNNVLIYEDGSVLSGGTWETYDQGWFAAFLNLLTSLVYDVWYPFPAGNPAPIPLKGAQTGEVIIGILGDWGTGDAAASAVMTQLMSKNPDYLVHVGDVYYSGSPSNQEWGGYYYYPNEEVNNLNALWPKSMAGRSFTLNSNHEMYTGANGLFQDALTNSSSAFTAQNGLSYFALRVGDWTILGLDSAYFGSSSNAFMDGNIGDVYGPQAQWIRGLQLNPKKVIVLTHHNSIAYDTSATTALFSQIRSALGDDPYAWYWGHVHNGIVYTSPLTAGGTTTNTYTRCLGHSGLPYAYASALNGNPNIEYLVESYQLPPNQQLLCNGSVTLTFVMDQKNTVRVIGENFYDLSSSQPKFSKRIF